MSREVRVWGGFGEKKSNNKTQWYFQNRIYDSNGLSPALTNYKSDYWVVIFEEEEKEKMKKLRNKRVLKLTVKDLKERLNELDENSEVVLGFYLKDQPNHFVYLADICEVGYDSVTKESTFNSKVVELMGYDDRFCTYIEKKE